MTGTYPNLKMVLLDCGLVLEMGPKQHINLVKVLGAFTKKDGRLAAQLMVDMSAERQQAQPIDVERFVSGVEQLCILDANQVCADSPGKTETAADSLINHAHGHLTFHAQNFIEKVGDYISDICYLACVHHVKLESTFVNAALSVEIMEGLASALYPDMRVQSIALPLVFKAEVMHRLGMNSR